jgi:hypothetical protein
VANKGLLKQEILDIDDTFCVAHDGQELAILNA